MRTKIGDENVIQRRIEARQKSEKPRRDLLGRSSSLAHQRRHARLECLHDCALKSTQHAIGQAWKTTDRSQYSPRIPNLIENPISGKLREIDSLDLLDV